MQVPQILILPPLERPSRGLMHAVARTDALGVQFLTDSADLDGLPGRVGVWVDGPAVLPAHVRLVIVPAGVDFSAWRDRTVLVQVTSADQAREAELHGASGFVAKGHEAGGVIGEEAAPILLQRLRAVTSLPVWLQGGVGLHTAGAAMALGAAGVVLDSQLACFEEAGLAADLREAIGSMDGSETAVIGGVRVFDRPGPLQGQGVRVGQDGAFSRGLRARFPRVADLVRGLLTSIDAHRGQAASLRPLAPGSPFAAQHGLRVPIAQGPMTRVSDVADFAFAVADGGGLPFLALSLVRGQALEDMLTSTAARLGDRTWGVGMLGFAPPELREEQLAIVRRLKPKVALLAGGRPAQARELEADGIPTYLHVPSPGLLDLFLKDGARRFVLEGRECGGHVGPRTSFVLWEQFVDRLLKFDDLHEVSVLFAGGVHDARSAAAVATLAAPLALGGAKIGVLMGTAYLFTEEAVSTGAITRTFQQAALGCRDTRLVHTAPGHATRCADSPFVTAFESARAAMEAAGEAPDSMWEKLERLNLGRLRIASKGTVREGDRLVAVDEATQRDQGMFMIGQVAALRGEVTTVRALHDEVSLGSSALLEAPARTEGSPVDVAIVGMAGFFPGAADLQAFWSHVVLGRDAVTEVPRARWNPAQYYDPDAKGGSKSISKWGGFLPPIDFDPLVYGIPPRSLPSVEPVQLLALEAARQALIDAGYGDDSPRSFDRDRASVIFGAEAGTDLASAYGFRALFPHYLGEIPDELDALLPSLTEDSFPGVLANVIAGRIANRLDLGGVNYTVDAACASSLAAVDLACKELAAGTSDLVLAGGADLHNTIADFLLFSSVHALSRTGRSRPFDAEADGIALGEGVAVLVCKRLADAERDGDRIYAVIKGVAGSSDGKSLGLTAPRKEGQMRALTRAYARSGVSPAEVGLAEAHGTGTVVGDRTELGTLTEVFSGGAAAPGSITLGSVKSNIGHTKCAAGLAGLVKCALALHHRVLPPSIHIRQPNPGWVQNTSPFVFRGAAAPWIGPARYAGVSAFGFGGTNFHCVLASHDVARAGGLPEWPAELFLFRDLHDLDRVKAHLAAGERLVDLAAAVSRRGTGAVKVAIVAESAEDLREKLDRAIADQEGRGVFRRAPIPGDLVFLFPGQGSQRPGMLAELFVAFPWLQDGLDPTWAARIFPGDAYDPAQRKAQRDALTDTRVAQPALGIVDLAASKLLEALGLRPARLAGHSYGELVALTVAGALPESALLGLSEARGRLILEAAGGDPGTMAAVKAPADVVSPHLTGHPDVVLANLNSPTQTVISGTTAGIARAVKALEAAGLEVSPIPVAAAFHSPVVAAASAGLKSALDAIDVGTPDRPVYANATAAPYGSDVARGLADQVRLPVRFQESIERMHADGGAIFVEVGPGRVLTRLVQQILGERVLARSLEDKKGGGALSGLVRLLAQLVAAGQEIDPTVLFEGRGRPLDLDAPPRRPSPTAWKIDGQRAWPVQGELPDHALKVVDAPLQLSGVGAREKVVLEYLETLRIQADQQRRVLLQYLGDAPLDELPPLITETAPLPPASAAAAEVRRSPSEVLLEVVSERTGYPAEMLDLDLDLEADLSIDSIKRIEILGVLGERLGIDAGEAGRDQLVEQLSGVKTLRGILERLGDSGGPVLQRWVGRIDVLAPPQPGSLAGKRVGVDARGAPGPGGATLVEALTAALAAEGARVQRIDADNGPDGLEAVVLLAGLASESPRPLGDRTLALATACRTTLQAGVKRLIVLTAQGGLAEGAGMWAAGVSGLVKSVAREWPDARVRRVDVDPGSDPGSQAEAVCAELCVDGPVEVAWTPAGRVGRTWVAAPLNGPALTLPREAVVLLTGGARGITARAAVAFAERFTCTVVLTGRSGEPPAEEPGLAPHKDAVALRRHLAGTGARPAEIEPKIRRILADREMRATFEALRRTGAVFEYHAVDVRDPDAVRVLIEGVYDRHGRIDWVIHGAGVNEDKLLAQKQDDSFLRVFETKLNGARNLLAPLREGLAGVAFFSSVAGAFGNRGQTDYAAANDALDTLARTLATSNPRARAVSVAWGPWAGGGMVDAALERQYAERGIGLVDPREGVDALLAELGSGGVPHAVWMASTPDDMA